jgi:hypothetical protein
MPGLRDYLKVKTAKPNICSPVDRPDISNLDSRHFNQIAHIQALVGLEYDRVAHFFLHAEKHQQA